MGQLTDLHDRFLTLLATAKAAAPAPGLRVYETGEPVELPEFPCAYILTPLEEYETMDYMTGRSVVTFTIRVLTDPRKPLRALLVIADVLIPVVDVWLRSTHPAPIDQARRLNAQPVTPEFGELPARGMDFPIRLELAFRAVHPAP